MKHIKILTAALFLVISTNTLAAEKFSLSSPDLTQGTAIKASQYWNNFGCTGDNARPQLDWKEVPADTKSFAVTFYDKDAPTGSGFWHWVVYNIPASTTSLDSKTLPTGAVEGNTDLGKPGFFGPCPPVGRQHNYSYRVHALDVETLEVPEGATAALTGFFIYQHTLAVASLSVVAGPREAK